MAIDMTAAIPNATTLIKRLATNANEPANPRGYCQEIKQKPKLHPLGEDTHPAAKP
jgi:hypothetical protein